MRDCVSCIHEYQSPMSEICRYCGIAMKNYEARPKPQTNSDRIRSMTDEELAKFLYEETDYPKEEYWLDWLKQEAEI